MDHPLSILAENCCECSALSFALMCWPPPSLKMGMFVEPPPPVSCLIVHQYSWPDVAGLQSLVFSQVLFLACPPVLFIEPGLIPWLGGNGGVRDMPGHEVTDCS